MKGRGRKALSESKRPMTSIERTKRIREKRRLLKNEMLKEGYEQVQVFLPKELIQALNIIEKDTGGGALDLNDTTELSYLVSYVIEVYATNYSKEEVASRQIIELVNSSSWPKNFTHKVAQKEALIALNKWTKENIN